jgi:nicotinate-nucleotide--dimethylbenzimidazole phosphoribosyltransferase
MKTPHNKNIPDWVSRLEARDEALYQQAKQRQLQLTKPPQSLGRLEELSCEIVAAMRTMRPQLSKKMVFVFAADHGITEEKVSAYPKEVTAQMVANFAHGGAAINAIARAVGAELTVVDVGVAGDLKRLGGISHRKISSGTRSFLREPAMSIDEVVAAMNVGSQIAAEKLSEGFCCFAIGEMGIGNTTSASAITAALTGLSPREITGRGTGVSEEVFAHKVSVIEAALALHQPETPMEILSTVGGLEIAAMVGAYLQIAAQQKVAICDGFISTAAAALAVAMQPAMRDYLFASHRSVEPGHRALLQFITREPLLDLQMRLGEATGAALAMPILEASVAALTQMATFEEAMVSSKS